MMLKKLAIVTTHPIQYYAPVFKLLTGRNCIGIKVFYTWGKASLNKHDPGFGKPVKWDLPLLDGYDYEWARNVSAQPGSHHFNGIKTPGLIARINHYQPDAVLIIGWAYHSHLQVMRYFKNRIPVYFRGDSTLLDERPGLKQILRTIFLRWVYRHADAAFYTGTHNKAYFNKYGLKEKQLVFAPHAVDNDRFAAPQADAVHQLKKQLDLHDDDVLILFAGKLEKKKSPGLLLAAFKALNHPRLHLLFTGNGELELELKQQAAGCSNIHFKDFQNQLAMPVIYQSADLFCLPSGGPGESWGLAVNEAMACGKAILVSDKCGCATDLVDNTNGMTFNAGDEAGLALALEKMTASKAVLKAFGHQSAMKIKAWSFLAIAKAIENKVNA